MNTCYVPVGGAYCFWVIHLSVRLSNFLVHSLTLETCMLPTVYDFSIWRNMISWNRAKNIKTCWWGKFCSTNCLTKWHMETVQTQKSSLIRVCTVCHYTILRNNCIKNKNYAKIIWNKVFEILGHLLYLEL